VTKSKVYSFRVDDATQEAIERLAEERDTTPSQLLRGLVIMSIDQVTAGERGSASAILDRAIELIEIVKNFGDHSPPGSL
jgi:hypothetical protein